MAALIKGERALLELNQSADGWRDAQSMLLDQVHPAGISKCSERKGVKLAVGEKEHAGFVGKDCCNRLDEYLVAAAQW